jgi:prepilin-type N-terminal cleavage/methylation domain-containing protein
MSRRGVSLVELLVALTLLGILAATAGGWLGRLRAAYRTTALEADRRQNLRAATAILAAEIRELDAADGDLVAIGPGALTIRASRQLAVLCDSPLPTATPGVVVLPLYDAPRYGLRAFRPVTDSVWVLAEVDSLAAPPVWLRGSVVARATAPCPDGGAGEQLTVALSPVPDPGARVARGSPVLGFEAVTYRLYRSSADGRWFIGQQTGGTVQPLIGPVTADGLTLSYFAADGRETTQPSLVRLIEIRVRAATPSPASAVDSAVTGVALRGAPP